jgi:uncharacterized protein YjbI with pentapeptide repeats
MFKRKHSSSNSQPSTKTKIYTQAEEQQIRAKAYQIWEERGKTCSPEENWSAAIASIRKQRLLKPFIALWQWSGIREIRGGTVAQLLISILMPVALFGAAQYFTARNDKNQQTIASERQQDEVLKNYFDQMTMLMLDKNLKAQNRGSEVANIARIRTLTALRQLPDDERKGLIIRFLWESKLIVGVSPIIDLSKFNLTSINLANADLSNINFSGANLSKANLSNTKLDGATLTSANFSSANLTDASLNSANLTNANFDSANMVSCYLNNVDFNTSNFTNSNLTKAKFIDAHRRVNNMSMQEVKTELEDMYSSAKPKSTRHDAPPRFDNANLTEADLSGADFTEASFAGANLYGANFYGATLIRANLNSTNLTFAILHFANFTDAYMNGADLSHVLTGISANFTNTDFSDANLSMASIDLPRSAKLCRTQLPNTELDPNRNCNVPTGMP